jgi:hypothetical protein
MASPPVLTPGGTTGFNRQSWQDSIEGATYQRQEFIPTIDEYAAKLLNTGNVRKYGRATASTLGQSDDGDVLTASDISATPITITPVGRYIQVAWSENERAQIDFDLGSGAADEIEGGMAEALDQAALAVIQSLTNTMSQAAVDVGMWRVAIGRLMGNTNGAFGPGASAEAKMLRAIFSHTQYPNVLAIEEFTHADVRGDSENPLVKGIFTKGGGINARFSSVVAQDGNGWHNAVYVSSAFVAGWNQRTKSFSEQTELLHRVNVYSNAGFSVKHNARAIALRTTDSALD